MELDQLKYQLSSKLAEDHAGRSYGEIAAMLGKQTASITAKLTRSLRIEIISCFVIIPLFLYLGSTLEKYIFRVYFLAFVIVFIPVLIIMILLLRKTKKLAAPTLAVRSNLEEIVHLMNIYTRRYFQMTMLLIPVCFVFVFLLLYSEKHGATFQPSGHGWFSAAWQIYLFIGIYVALLTIFIYRFTKWYLKKLYGKYVDQLKACIDELTANS